MRSYEERCAEVKRRIAAEKRKKRLRRGRLVMAAAAAACLALLAGVLIAMPGMTAQLQPDSCTGFETVASTTDNAWDTAIWVPGIRRESVLSPSIHALPIPYPVR